MKKLILALLMILPFSAYSASPTSFVSGPSVSSGVTSFEVRAGYSWDDESASLDERFQLREHIDHGFNDLYAMRIIAAQDDRQNDDLDQDAFTLENRFQIFNSKDHGWDGGFRLSYSANHGRADSVGLKLIGQKKWTNDITSRHNLNFGHQVGGGSADGISFGLSHQIMHKTDISWLKKSSAGIEMFNDFGNLRTQSGYSNQDHQMGPVFKGSFDNGLSFETGYRTGISRASRDHLVKLGIAKSF